MKNLSDKKVIMYSQPTWPPCFSAKAWLEEEGIPFEVRDIRVNPKYIDELMQLEVNATPAFKIGETVIRGFQPMAVKEAWSKYNQE